MKARVTPKIEAYLPTILRIEQEHVVARVKDIALEMGVSYTSASAAVSRLRATGLVRHEKYGYVELTARGQEIAKQALRRLRAVYDFLVLVLQVDPKAATRQACHIEAQITPDTARRLAGFVELVCACPHSAVASAMRGTPAESEEQREGAGLSKKPVLLAKWGRAGIG